MKKIALVTAAIGMTLALSGCKTETGTVVTNTPFDKMQESVSKIGKDGGIAAIGTGQSRDMQIAREKAIMEARKNLAQVCSLKVENAQKKFLEEIGEAADAEINQMFSSATKTITSRELMGSMPTEQKWTVKDGIYTSYVLMEVNPDVVVAALEKQISAQKATYTRFRASEAFSELSDDVERYEAYQKELADRM